MQSDVNEIAQAPDCQSRGEGTRPPTGLSVERTGYESTYRTVCREDRVRVHLLDCQSRGQGTSPPTGLSVEKTGYESTYWTVSREDRVRVHLPDFERTGYEATYRTVSREDRVESTYWTVSREDRVRGHLPDCQSRGQGTSPHTGLSVERTGYESTYRTVSREDRVESTYWTVSREDRVRVHLLDCQLRGQGTSLPTGVSVEKTGYESTYWTVSREDRKKMKIQELLVELGEEPYTWDVVTNSLTILDNMIPPTANGPVTMQTGIQESEDESSLVSSTNDENFWLFNKSGGLQTATSDGVIGRMFCGAEAFEMGKIKTCSSLMTDLSALTHRTPFTACENDDRDVILVSTPCDLVSVASTTRPSFQERARTPSYPGLKFLHDFCSLKETAILSDSDTDMCDQNSATDHYDDAVDTTDVTSSLLSQRKDCH
ncbi:hypothetical protein LSAT2_032560 [Lamellibrachia satsuma]|nr:hypothetical protein LSAT2_032560 [Lamellibrachia satsuma]